jgi:hypothetical protein
MTPSASLFLRRVMRMAADGAPALLVAAALASATLVVGMAFGHDKAQAFATLAAMGWAATVSPTAPARHHR